MRVRFGDMRIRYLASLLVAVYLVTLAVPCRCLAQSNILGANLAGIKAEVSVELHDCHSSAEGSSKNNPHRENRHSGECSCCASSLSALMSNKDLLVVDALRWITNVNPIAWMESPECMLYGLSDVESFQPNRLLEFRLVTLSSTLPLRLQRWLI